MEDSKMGLRESGLFNDAVKSAVQYIQETQQEKGAEVFV